MKRTLPWQTPARNYYPLPKVLCRLGLSPGEIAVYSLYYRVVVIRAPLQGLCYTIRDAVDWLRSPTA